MKKFKRMYSGVIILILLGSTLFLAYQYVILHSNNRQLQSKLDSYHSAGSELDYHMAELCFILENASGNLNRDSVFEGIRKFEKMHQQRMKAFGIEALEIPPITLTKDTRKLRGYNRDLVFEFAESGELSGVRYYEWSKQVNSIDAFYGL